MTKNLCENFVGFSSDKIILMVLMIMTDDDDDTFLQ